jgi:hypothetical protein
MRRDVAWAASVANDPIQTLVGWKYCTAASPDLLRANPLCCHLDRSSACNLVN